MSAVAQRLRRRELTSTGIVYLLLAVSLLVGALLTASQGRNFFASGNIADVLTGTSILGFFAIGQTMVILAGSLDLSVPFVASLVSLIAGGIMADQSGNVPRGVLTALVVAAAIGLVNGLIVSKLGVHGFMATLGVGLVISGYLATNYQGSQGRAPRSFQLIGATLVGPVPLSTIIMLITALVAIVVLRRTRIGHHLYAVGGNRQVAHLSGVRTAPPVILAHMFCSVTAALAGLLLLSRTGIGSPTVGGQGSYELMSIAAVVLGGAVLAGGKGNILGTLGGVAIFAVMNNVMSVMDVNPLLRDTIRGVIIIAAVAVYAKRNIQRRPTRFDAAPRATRLLEAGDRA